MPTGRRCITTNIGRRNGVKNQGVYHRHFTKGRYKRRTSHRRTGTTTTCVMPPNWKPMDIPKQNIPTGVIRNMRINF